MCISLLAATTPVWAQSANDNGGKPLTSVDREEILNDSRTTSSAEAATAARTRGVRPPAFEVDHADVTQLTERAVAAASCELAELEFATGSSDISPEALRELSPVAECLKNQRSAVMWLIGEADNQGVDAANWVLAMDRALAVKDALRSMGVNERQLVPVSAGPTGERSVSFDLAEQRLSSPAVVGSR
jgi:outer membrane protein OmpA-like peptidoglycan-associated protein